jgi:hypothetical protein
MKRYENYEQAKLIQNHLIETYEGMATLFRSSEDTIDNKFFFILDEILSS